VSRDRAAVVAEQKRWVRTHASIEKVTEELQRVYQRYIRTPARALAA
jgi:hypothetical protein